MKLSVVADFRCGCLLTVRGETGIIDMRELFWVIDRNILYLVYKELLREVYTFVKTHITVYLKLVHFVDKL